MRDRQKQLLSRIKPSENDYLRKLAGVGFVDIAQIDAVINEVVADRMRLARQILDGAKSIGLASDMAQRKTVSACYYSQYHAARAVVLFVDRVDRDDHEKLPNHMDKIFPRTTIGGSLSTMLDRRRCVDYDPYLSTFDLAAESAGMVAQTEAFLQPIEAFLRAAGVAT